MTATPPPAATTIINVRAVDERGQLRDGWQLDEFVPDVDIDAASCDEPSGAAASPNTYACNARVFSADACWRLADGDLVCIHLPWDRTVSRRKIAGELPQTPRADAPEPLGIQLEDGSRYRRPNGVLGPQLPPEGFDVAYSCVSGPCNEEPAKHLAVLTGVDSPSAVSQDEEAWTVIVGELAADESGLGALPTPESQYVTRAWFVTAE